MEAQNREKGAYLVSLDEFRPPFACDEAAAIAEVAWASKQQTLGWKQEWEQVEQTGGQVQKQGITLSL